MTLQQFFTQHPKAALAFSGGSDSAYLLWAGRTFGQDVRPYYVSTPFQPAWEREDAQRLARELGVPLTVVELDVLGGAGRAGLPRGGRQSSKPLLFLQKGPLFCPVAAGPGGWLFPAAGRHQRLGRRPGPSGHEGPLGAGGALPSPGVRRHQGPAAGSEPRGGAVYLGQARLCLSGHPHSHGHPHHRPRFVTAPDLARVEGGEDALFALGFTDFRIRLRGDAALLQLPQDQMDRAVAQYRVLLDALSPHFSQVFLDLNPRKKEEFHGQ